MYKTYGGPTTTWSTTYSETMDAVSLTDLQRNMDLQRQVGYCTDVAQELDRNYTTSSLSDTIKLLLFHGYESENFDCWLEKFLLAST